MRKLFDTLVLPYTPAADVDGGTPITIRGTNVFIAQSALSAAVLSTLDGSPQVLTNVGYVDSVAGAQGDYAYWDATNSEATNARALANPFIGVLSEAHAASTGGSVNLLYSPVLQPVLFENIVADSTAVSDTTDETAFNKTITIPANFLRAGDVVRIKGSVVATATNSTDTLTVKVKIGSTVIHTITAVDVANNDAANFDIEVTIRTIGATGTMVAMGFAGVGVPATATSKVASLASTAIDTTASKAVSATATWSAASAGDSCKLSILSVQVIR